MGMGVTRDNAAERRHWPYSAAQMNLAMGGNGTWASAWLCNETTGDMADQFGAITLAAEISPRYGDRGAMPGDRALGFDIDTADAFRAASTATYDLDETMSLAIYTCFKFDSAPNNRFMINKIGFGDGYGLVATGGGGSLYAYIDGAVSAAQADLAFDHQGGFHDALMVIDRTDQRLQLFSDLGTSSAVDISAVTTLAVALKFSIGGSTGGNATGWACAFAAVATADVNNLRLNGAAAIAAIRKFTRRV